MLYFRCGNFITKHWTFVAGSGSLAGTIPSALGPGFCFITDNLILIKANVQYGVSHQIQKRTIFSILFSKDKILPQNRTEYSHYDVGSELNQSMSRSDGNLLRVVSGGNTFQNCCTLENGNNRLSFPFEYITKLAFVDDKSKLQNTIITVL